jgi:hypothetical protein
VEINECHDACARTILPQEILTDLEEFHLNTRLTSNGIRECLNRQALSSLSRANLCFWGQLFNHQRG